MESIDIEDNIGIFIALFYNSSYNFIEGIMKNLTKNIILLLLALVLSQAHLQTTPVCPVGSQYLNLHHGHLSISVGGVVSITPGIDSLCYNYPLPSPFQERPGVAIAIYNFESNPSQDLFFSIQTTRSDTLTSLSFLIRTQWKYTTWSLFKMTFFA